MNNKYLYENILTLTKSLTMIYINGTIEASNKKIRNVMEKGLKECLLMQDEIYQKMSNDGYYDVANITSTEIKKFLKKINKDEG